MKYTFIPYGRPQRNQKNIWFLFLIVIVAASLAIVAAYNVGVSHGTRSFVGGSAWVAYDGQIHLLPEGAELEQQLVFIDVGSPRYRNQIGGEN